MNLNTTDISENIKLASHAGFCYGVKRAVETTKKLKKENPGKEIYVLGELIHNTQVINELKELGIKTVDDISQIPYENKDSICIIRSHGAPYDVFSGIKQRGLEVVDLTCPDVKKVQDRAVQLAKEDYFVIILGKEEHPEVVGIMADAQKFASKKERVYVAKNLDALKKIEAVIKKEPKIGIVIQTTQRIEFLREVLDYLAPISKELRVINTICASTSLRQNEARNLAKESDLMVVVGSKKSANTTHLAEILAPVSKTIHIEDDSEIQNYKDLIQGAKNIGITAGASTPDYIINKVIETLQKYIA